MEEVPNILRILRETKKFVASDNSDELKNLSNQTIHSATISQDPDNIIVAVLVYSLGKVLERKHYEKMEGWKEFHAAMTKNLDAAVAALEKEDIEGTRLYLGRIRDSLNKISGDLGMYIKDVFRKAEINKAFKLYEHGLSSEQTASLLGVSLWDMASYIGQSTISNAKASVSMPVRRRIKIAEDIFK
ncbi:MAG: hypothetical protein NUV97_00935 [archaeon]|nr:hypothetical protein [archaeon]MCR4323474.1 hypothetical protein [Nanoarchaeota archaeon]